MRNPQECLLPRTAALAVLAAAFLLLDAGVRTAEARIASESALASLVRAAERLAEKVESELRYPEGADGIDTRVLACFAAARDLDRMRAVPDLEDGLRKAFFSRGVRIVFVDAGLLESTRRTDPRPARARIAFLGDAEAGEIRIEGEEPPFPPVGFAYCNRPWVHDPSGFRAARALKGAVSVTGESGLEGSAEDALRAALESAAAALREEAVRLAGERGKLRGRDRSPLPGRLASVLPTGIIERNFLSDQYLEEIVKPYGSVYRAAVLVEADGSSLSHAVSQLLSDLERDRWSRLKKAGAIALAAPLLLGLYFWLDSSTRGYFSGLLKLALVLGFGGITWGVLQMNL